MNGNGKVIEFRARPEQGCGNELCSKWSENDFRRAERRHGTQNGSYTPWENSMSLLCVKYVWRSQDECHTGVEEYHGIMQN